MEDRSGTFAWRAAPFRGRPFAHSGYHDRMPDPRTEELKLEVRRRRADERERAEHSTEEHEALTHERRADRAAYLEEKLAERARSEEERGRSGS